MTHFRFLGTLADVPLAGDPNAADIGLQMWREACQSNADEIPRETFTSLAEWADAIADDANGKRVLTAIFGNSPFLTSCAVREPALLCRLLTDGPDHTWASLYENLTENLKQHLNDEQLSRALRIAKRRVALSIAIADICGVWPLEKITGGLSEFASTALSAATGHLLRAASAQGAFRLTDINDPERGSGLVVLGMGKLGAGELNYSSDIDLIVLFDPERVDTDDRAGLQNHFVRLARNLVKLMEERTVDGYVFRTDLRLRPDPGATPLALSVLAGETYYESLGQNWERAAMIKARPVAGDIAAGEAFLKRLGPFIWRKSLDYAAIQDIHSIKRQINSRRGGSTDKAEGHNIKLGRGGIREIEFFAQTQQLIWGGREVDLRSPVTLTAIHDLARFQQCTDETTNDLTVAYNFLRRVEHRLQMVNDEQTQTLPDDPAALDRFAVFLGYPDGADFRRDLMDHLNRVQDHYSQLFASAPSLSSDTLAAGNLAFTGGDPDPDTLKTLAEMGFREPQLIDTAVRAWHHGRYRATRSTRAREILTELMPSLLKALAATADPDTTFLRFDAFLKGLPSGVQLFSLFQAHPDLFQLVGEIMGTAPRLARHLSNRPTVLDSVLTPDFFAPLPDAAALEAELDGLLYAAGGVEEILDVSRRWAHDRRFQVGVHRLRQLTETAVAARCLSDIAETALACLYPRVEREFASRHGRLAGAEMAVVALGKLGSREMMATSDLDLVFVYHPPVDAETLSDGDKPLSAPQYFARLGQRLINAISAMTAEGRLYEVDMRLRPSGNSGPIATTVEGFERYYRESAWTWEYMALTRARVVVASSQVFRDDVGKSIAAVLNLPRSADDLLRDVAEMRARLFREKPGIGPWALKLMPGGLVDIEFIVQYLLLRHPEAQSPNTRQALDNLARHDAIEAEDAAQLIDALKLWQGLQGMLAIAIEGDIADGRAGFSDSLKSHLVIIGDVEDFTALEAQMADTARRVREIFDNLIERPAAGLPTVTPDETPTPPV